MKNILHPAFEENIQVSEQGENLKSRRIMSTLHKDQYTFMNVSRSILLKMRNISDKRRRENQNKHFMFNNVFPKIIPL
jgi:hypothetical protein